MYLSTSRATSLGVLIPSSAATAPARRVGPCMQEASSWTTPSSFGSPPYPTELSAGSSSWILTPSTAASSVSVPSEHQLHGAIDRPEAVARAHRRRVAGTPADDRRGSRYDRRSSGEPARAQKGAARDRLGHVEPPQRQGKG